MQLVAVDIGGTHARFALAEVEQGRVVSLGEAVTLKTAEHGSFQLAWEEFGRTLGTPLPKAAAIAVAGPVGGEIIRFTNNPWIIRPALIPEKLGADDYVVVNDFAAVAHAVAQAAPEHFVHLTGPDTPLPEEGVISVVGPGTGLGVAQLWRYGGTYRVQPTEGGHIDFAPLDGIEDAILARLRKRHRRVSAERVVAGPGIVDIYETLAAIEGKAITASWTDKEHLACLARRARTAWPPQRWTGSVCRWAAVAGDLALAQGSQAALVIAGGLGLRIKRHPAHLGLCRAGSAPRAGSRG